jgi:ferric-dicitrate binding protein FerR (iron transport regulator)
MPVEAGTLVTDYDGRMSVARMSASQMKTTILAGNMLTFEETPLSDIVSEINRYNERKLEVTNQTRRKI